jgi:hypothetical protein
MSRTVSDKRVRPLVVVVSVVVGEDDWGESFWGDVLVLL